MRPIPIPMMPIPIPMIPVSIPVMPIQMSMMPKLSARSAELASLDYLRELPGGANVF